jgi:hypothetical protein
MSSFAALLLAMAPPPPVSREEARRQIEDVLVRARAQNERRTDAMRARLAAHAAYNNCVKSNALSLASAAESAEALADTSMAYCRGEEFSLSSLAYDQCEAFGEKDAGTCRDDMMNKWRESIRADAVGCVVAKRARPATVGGTICKRE